MTAARAMRFAAVIVVAASYALVVRSGEARLAAQVAGNARTAERLRTARTTLASGAALAHERARLRAEEPNLAGRDAVARFVADAARAAGARRSAITTIANAARAGAAETHLDVTIAGRYADVLGTIRALSGGHVPAAIDVDAIARANAAGPDASVTASVRAVLDAGSETSR